MRPFNEGLKPEWSFMYHQLIVLGHCFCFALLAPYKTQPLLSGHISTTWVHDVFVYILYYIFLMRDLQIITHLTQSSGAVPT